MTNMIRDVEISTTIPGIEKDHMQIHIFAYESEKDRNEPYRLLHRTIYIDLFKREEKIIYGKESDLSIYSEL